MTITIQPDQIDAPQVNVATQTTTSTFTLGSTVINGLENWVHVSANTTLAANTNYFANTQANTLTLTLPASASIGDTIQVVDVAGFAGNNNITLARNSHNIDGSARNAVLNIDRGGVRLTYLSTTEGWTSKKRESRTRFSGAQGEVFGYASGGATPTRVDTIDKFTFATDNNASDVGNLTVTRSSLAGQSSLSHGYSSGGGLPTAPSTQQNVIDKFPFAVDINAIDVGDLTQARTGPGGQSSDINGYSSGGFAPPQSNVIDKFPFATDTNASDVGDLTQVRDSTTGSSSSVNGYTMGGAAGPPGRSNVIDKFPFATDTNASDVGDLTQNNKRFGSQSSSVFGYTSGGDAAPGISNVIDKFPFASDNNATNVGDLTQARVETTGQSSIVSGYTTGGDAPPFSDIIEKFPFASDANASDVGNLTQARSASAGQQV